MLLDSSLQQAADRRNTCWPAFWHHVAVKVLDWSSFMEPNGHFASRAEEVGNCKCVGYVIKLKPTTKMRSHFGARGISSQRIALLPSSLPKYKNAARRLRKVLNLGQLSTCALYNEIWASRRWIGQDGQCNDLDVKQLREDTTAV